MSNFFIKGAEHSRAHTKLDSKKSALQDKCQFRGNRDSKSVGASINTNKCSGKIDAHSLVRKLSSPGCNIVEELNKIRLQYPDFFINAGRLITTILSQLGRNIDVHNEHTKHAAFQFWDWVKKEAQLNHFHYNSFLNICDRCKDWERAIRILNVEMKDAGVRKDEFSYTSAINACMYKSEKGLELFYQMRREGIKPPNDVLYTAVISVCSKGYNLDGAMKVFSIMKADGIHPSDRTYSAMISCCEKCRNSNLALQFLKEMKKGGVEDEAYSYSAAIGALGNCGRWEKAMELFRESDNNERNEITCSATITALVKSLQWEKALDLFEELKHKNNHISVVAYGSAIAACEKGFQYLQCLDYLDELATNQVPKNHIIYGATISCMEKCFRCDIIFKLFQHMKIDQINPNVIIYNSIMRACAKCQLWKEGLDFFYEMNTSQVQATLITYNAVLDLTCPYDMTKANEIFDQGIQRGFYARVFKSRNDNSSLQVDLHFCSVGAGIVGLLWWFDKCLIPHFAKTNINHDNITLDIITGYGKSRMESILKTVNYTDKGLIKHVRKVLSLLHLKEIPHWNKGMLRLCADTFQKELVNNDGKIVLDTKAYMEFVVEELNTDAADIQSIKQIRRGFVQQGISNEIKPTDIKPTSSTYESKKSSDTSTQEVGVSSEDKKKSKKENKKRMKKDSILNEQKNDSETKKKDKNSNTSKDNEEYTSALNVGVTSENRKKSKKENKKRKRKDSILSEQKNDSGIKKQNKHSNAFKDNEEYTSTKKVGVVSVNKIKSKQDSILKEQPEEVSNEQKTDSQTKKTDSHSNTVKDNEELEYFKVEKKRKNNIAEKLEPKFDSMVSDVKSKKKRKSEKKDKKKDKKKKK